MNRADFEPALQRAGLIDGPLPPAPPDGGPWYLQAVSGFGAWLAALLVLSMLGGLVGDLWSSTGARMLIGGALCAGAAVVARRAQAQAAGAREGAFLAQFMLACALAGIALLGSVVVEHVHGSVRQAGALALLAAVLLAANPERVHRALMAWMLVVSVIAALWLLKLEPLISIGLAAVTAALWLGQARWAAAGVLPVTAPVGVACAGMLVLLQAPDVVPPEVASQAPFALDATRSALVRCAGLAVVLAAAGILVARRVGGEGPRTGGEGPRAGGDGLPVRGDGLPVRGDGLPVRSDGLPMDSAGRTRSSRAPLLIGLFSVLLAAAAWRTPGVVACLLVWLLGTWAGRSQLVWYALAGLAAYLGMRYYALDMDLMDKGVAMIVVAAVLLGARLLLPLVWRARAVRAPETDA